MDAFIFADQEVAALEPSHPIQSKICMYIDKRRVHAFAVKQSPELVLFRCP